MPADEPASDDIEAVTALLGRRPSGRFAVAVRHADGSPVVIRNEPWLDDGTPMPTRWWLVGEPERTEVSRLESRGAIGRAEAEIGLDAIADAHRRYAAERDSVLRGSAEGKSAGRKSAGGKAAQRATPGRGVPGGTPSEDGGPRPSGGVGGTRRGIKCLHAHYAWHLAGGDDPVGRWVAARLAEGEGDRRTSPSGVGTRQAVPDSYARTIGGGRGVEPGERR